MKIDVVDPMLIRAYANVALRNPELVESVAVTSESDEFKILCRLPDHPLWPKAVPDDWLDVSPGARRRRARRIAHEWLPSFAGKRVLDYGCGNGMVVDEVAEGGGDIVGFDPFTGFTAKAEGPFDLIFAFDVLDHAVGKTPTQILTEMKGLLAPDGRIALRLHPWSSRHGEHPTAGVNKAFAHLVCDPLELELLGHSPPPLQRVVRPVETYHRWVAEAGLEVVKRTLHRTPVEKFFLRYFFGKLTSLYPRPSNRMPDDTLFYPSLHLEIDFVDMVLKEPDAI